MADLSEDTNVTGNADNEATVENRKKIIKYVIIALALAGAYWVVKKYVLK